MAVVVLTALAAWAILRPHTPRLVERISAAEATAIEGRLTGLRAYPYDVFDRALWNDRSYHTFQWVRRLEGLHFVPIGRNEEQAYVLEVTANTTLITLANQLDLRGVKEWNVLPDTVLVNDVVTERKFDLLLSLEVGPGTYRVLSFKSGPSKPVFFDPAAVRVMD